MSEELQKITEWADYVTYKLTFVRNVMLEIPMFVY